jgi:hypothetical protein
MAVLGFIGLAALSAAAVLDVGSPTAEAAPPSVSQFAGSYVGTIPGFGSFAVAISDRGRITGSTILGVYLDGRVHADGSYSFTVIESGHSDGDGHGNRHWNNRYPFAGNMALDSDGNIFGTTDDGGSFFWLRQ